jgi:hypothetical protein
VQADIVSFSSQVAKVRALSLKCMLASAFKAVCHYTQPERLCTKLAHFDRVVAKVCALTMTKTMNTGKCSWKEISFEV